MKRYRVEVGTKVKLSDWDPNDKSRFKGSKQQAEAELEKLSLKLGELQELLHAERQRKVLIVLQGMDTSGKDGTIRHVFHGINPLGVRVASFKAPTAEELDHDFLWRVHQRTPGRGEIVIFNRSHYEDVLVVRVHELVPEEVWKRRYDQIRDFERLLTESGTTILKFFLYIDRDEQKKRLEERLEDGAKQWKFNPGDLSERKLWDDYMRAYEDAIEKTSTSDAPWYVVPANRKWYRNLVISTVLIDTLESLGMKYPESVEGLEGIRVE
jgi:PPK2 family polyphosphate:nucleotide phosphotransferase